MKIVLTGTPGTGKTSIAKLISVFFALPVINDNEFARKYELGELNSSNGEFEIDLDNFKEKFQEFTKEKPGWIAEGHIFCEFDSNPDYLFVLRTETEALEERLSKRHYSEEKLQDNLMVEGMDYCLKNSKKNTNPKKVIEVNTTKSIENAFQKIIGTLSKEANQ